jgi:hypothetical protein
METTLTYQFYKVTSHQPRIVMSRLTSSARSLISAIQSDEISQMTLETLANYGFFTCIDRDHRIALFAVYSMIQKYCGGNEEQLDRAFQEKKLNEWVAVRMKGRGEMSRYYKTLLEKGRIESITLAGIEYFDVLPAVADLARWFEEVPVADD